MAFSFANEQSTFLVVQRARDRNNARAIHLAYSSAASNTRAQQQQQQCEQQQQ